MVMCLMAHHGYGFLLIKLKADCQVRKEHNFIFSSQQVVAIRVHCGLIITHLPLRDNLVLKQERCTHQEMHLFSYFRDREDR